MKSLFFFLKDRKLGSFVQVTSCDLRVDNKLFERWNYDIMSPLNLLFRTFNMEGDVD